MKEKLTEKKLTLNLAEKIDKFSLSLIGDTLKHKSPEDQLNEIFRVWEFDNKLRVAQNYFFSRFVIKTKYDQRWSNFMELKNIEFEDIQNNECFQEFHQQLTGLGLDSLLIDAVETNILLMQKAFHDENKEKNQNQNKLS